MPTATLTSKGQITIPLTLRTALGQRNGAKLDFIQQADGFKVVPLRITSSTLNGRFAGRVTQAATLAGMDEAVAQEAAARHSRVEKDAV